MREYISKAMRKPFPLPRILQIAAQGRGYCLFGRLGCRKTAFTTGLAKGLGITCDVSSPTFAICNEYRENGVVLCHFDMYRVDGWDDLYSTAFLII